jgi:signal transduction histidine kinase
LGDLDRLLAQTAAAGVHVDVRVSGEPHSLPADVELTAFRIVQEALTNVVKHASTPSCRLLLGYQITELSIEVIDDGLGCPVPVGAGRGAAGAEPLDEQAIPPGGHGIIGMRERVSIFHGQFNAGPVPGRGFRVTARLPLAQGAQ